MCDLLTVLSINPRSQNTPGMRSVQSINRPLSVLKTTPLKSDWHAVTLIMKQKRKSGWTSGIIHDRYNAPSLDWNNCWLCNHCRELRRYQYRHPARKSYFGRSPWCFCPGKIRSGVTCDCHGPRDYICHCANLLWRKTLPAPLGAVSYPRLLQHDPETDFIITDSTAHWTEALTPPFPWQRQMNHKQRISLK